MSVRLSIDFGVARESARKLPGTWHRVKPLDSGQLERWMNNSGLGVYIEVTPEDTVKGGYGLSVWWFNTKTDATDTIGFYTVKRKAYAAAYNWMRLYPTAGEFSRKGFLRRHKTLHRAGRATKRGLKRAGHDVRRGAKRGTGYVYHKL